MIEIKNRTPIERMCDYKDCKDKFAVIMPLKSGGDLYSCNHEDHRKYLLEARNNGYSLSL